MDILLSFSVSLVDIKGNNDILMKRLHFLFKCICINLCTDTLRGLTDSDIFNATI